MKHQHTPLPWSFHDGTIYAHSKNTREEIPLAHVDGTCFLTDQIGNGRLMAAAPVQLQALTNAFDFIERTLDHGTIDTDSRVDLTEALKRIRQALSTKEA